MGRGVEGAPWQNAYANMDGFSGGPRRRLRVAPTNAHSVVRWSILGQLPGATLDRVWVGDFEPIKPGVFEAKLTAVDGE